MRDDSGWKMAEPAPTTAAASMSMLKVGATASITVPAMVKHMPTANA